MASHCRGSLGRVPHAVGVAAGRKDNAIKARLLQSKPPVAKCSPLLCSVTAGSYCLPSTSLVSGDREGTAKPAG